MAATDAVLQMAPPAPRFINGSSYFMPRKTLFKLTRRTLSWGEHRVNSRVRAAQKTKGLLGANDTTVQVLDRLDLTRAQKRAERFNPQDAVIVFNHKVP